MNTYDVRVHELKQRADRGKGRSYRVRWHVTRKLFERSFRTKALADNFRSGLIRATQKGEAFDEVTGLPGSAARARIKTTWYEHVREYVKEKWPRLAAKSRRSMVEALTTVTVELVDHERRSPGKDALRRALYRWALNPNAWDTEPDREIADALSWLEKASTPVVRLTDKEIVRRALNACSRKLDGKPAAPKTVSRKRAALYNALGFAVERDLLEYNPVDKIQWTAPAAAETVDRRVVANAAQVEQILSAVPTVNRNSTALVAFYGCLYYAGMRPSEAASLRRADCELPETGWGRIVLAETAPRAGGQWTDDGDPCEVRGLKHRGQGEVRPVPIPPELVVRLNEHVEQFGTSVDGLLFRGARGGRLSDSVYDRVWKAARTKVLTPEQVSSPLARRPYDLRHAAISLWLNGGVPAPEIARRVGHGVAVLLKVYANCIDGEEETVNAKIAAALEASRGRGRIVGNAA